MNHTPTPWKLVPIGKNLYVEPVNPTEKSAFICDMQLDATENKAQVATDAAYLIHCVNLHEELVATLKRTEAMLRNETSYHLALDASGKKCLGELLQEAIAKADFKKGM